jgi:hypothetical protein
MTVKGTSIWMSAPDKVRAKALQAAGHSYSDIFRAGLKALESPRAVKAREAREQAEAEAEAAWREEQAAKAARVAVAERALEAARAGLRGRDPGDIPRAEKIRVAVELSGAGVSQSKIGALFGVSKQGVAYWLETAADPAGGDVPHVVPFRAAAVRP